MGFNLMLIALGVPRLQAGSKTLHNEVLDVIPDLNLPVGVAVSADGKYVYVAEFGNKTLTVIDAASDQILYNAIYAGSKPYGVALTPNGKKVYVTSTGEALGFRTNNLIQSQLLLSSGTNFGLAVSPNGKTLYVVNGGNNQISVFDTGGQGSFVTNIAVGNVPVYVAFTPDGKTAYVTKNNDGTVSVIDVKTNSVTGSPITGLTYPRGINITPDGKTAYALDLHDVAVIDTKTNMVSSSIDLS